MTSRERIRNLIAGRPADRCGFWLGMPQADTWPRLHAYFGTSDREELRRKLGDDYRWICPSFFQGFYRHPQGRDVFGLSRKKESHGQAGPLAHCETVSDVEAYEWPNPDYLNFDEVLAALRAAGDVYRASGFWTSFYHNIMDLFGMEEYMVKMYTIPKWSKPSPTACAGSIMRRIAASSRLPAARWTASSSETISARRPT